MNRKTMLKELTSYERLLYFIQKIKERKDEGTSVTKSASSVLIKSIRKENLEIGRRGRN